MRCQSFDIELSVVYEPAEQGWFTATIPAFPGVISAGASKPEARALKRRLVLACHRDLEAFVGGDQVVEVLGGGVDVDLDPFDGSGEAAGLGGVVVADGRRGV